MGTPQFRAMMVGWASRTSAPLDCAFTTPLTDRVTVNVCGEDEPETAVTVITSPATMMSNGASPAAVVQMGPDVVGTEIDVAVDVAEELSWDPSVSMRPSVVSSRTPTWYGLYGEPLKENSHRRWLRNSS